MSNPKIWGHHAWVVVHGVARLYPSDFLNFFMILLLVLPCASCRQSFPVILSEITIQFHASLVARQPEFAIKIHQAVTDKLIQQKQKFKTYRNSYMERYTVTLTNIPEMQHSLREFTRICELCVSQGGSGIRPEHINHLRQYVEEKIRVYSASSSFPKPTANKNERLY
jgi:hypothetical protein